SWFRGEGGAVAFGEAIDSYDRAVELDPTEMRVYAVQSLLAKSDMLIEKGKTSEPPDSGSLKEGVRVLQEIIDNPIYRSNPTVHKGIPQRKLADLIREDDPMFAISLLSEGLKNQGDLEEGYENLEIGLIYKDLLDDPDQAVEYFERVRQNELAPREVKKYAEEFLDGIQAGHLDNPNLYPGENLELFSLEEIDP
ncbi:MAG: hypothetical protein KC931_22880, partial [Candidatus Omnitrophica bacterium]|nr:hypothetical protein [Candidatus Omnitrophota bacterium]